MMQGPCSAREATLLATYRESMANDQVLLEGLIELWAALSQGQRAIVYRMADALVSASAWRRSPLDAGHVDVHVRCDALVQMIDDALVSHDGARP